MYKRKKWGKKQFIFAGIFLELLVILVIFASAQGFIETKILKISEKTHAKVINVSNISFVKDNIGQDVTQEKTALLKYTYEQVLATQAEQVALNAG